MVIPTQTIHSRFPAEGHRGLWDFCSRWLKPETPSPAEIVELVTLEQSCQILPAGPYGWVFCHLVTCLEEVYILQRTFWMPNYSSSGKRGNLVGTLEPSSSRCWFMLVIIDYAARCPRARHPCSATCQTIATKSMEAFAEVGFPSVILMDQDTALTSQVIKEVWALLKIQLVKTSYIKGDVAKICN